MLTKIQGNLCDYKEKYSREVAIFLITTKIKKKKKKKVKKKFTRHSLIIQL